MKRFVFLAVVLVLLLSVVLVVAIRRQQRSPSLTPGQRVDIVTQAPKAELASVTRIVEDGARVDWSSQLDIIAYDTRGDDGFYDVYTMSPDGSGQVCLTCDAPGLPGKNMGQPAWHPSSEYIVFQAEKRDHPGGSRKARPGVGVENNLWLITRDGMTVFQLTDLPDDTGVLHPHFSNDGSRLLWAEMIRPPGRGDILGGEWAIKLADFVVDQGVPRLENIQTFQPGGPVFYETHGFNSDDTKVLFTGNLDPGQPVWGMDIYTMDLASQEVENLTSTPDQWDEHAQYSPSFDKIVWMSSMGCDCDPSKLRKLKTDLWIMNADGTGKTRLSHFSDADYPERAGKRVITGDMSWGPDGRRLAVFLITDRGLFQLLGLAGGGETIVMVEFREPQ